VVVPHIKLRDLAVGTSEGLGAVPSDIVGYVVVIAGLTESLWKWIVAPLLRVRDIRPRSERPMNSDAIIVDLITTANPITISIFPQSDSIQATHITWKGFSLCTLCTSFQSAGPLQASSSVPTENPLQE